MSMHRGVAAPLFWCAAAALRGADARCLFVCLLNLCVCLSCFLLCLLCVGLFGCLGLGILLLFSHMFFLQPDSLTIARVFCFYSRVLCFYSRVFCFYSRVFCFYSGVLCFYSRGPCFYSRVFCFYSRVFFFYCRVLCFYYSVRCSYCSVWSFYSRVFGFRWSLFCLIGIVGLSVFSHVFTRFHIRYCIVIRYCYLMFSRFFPDSSRVGDLHFFFPRCFFLFFFHRAPERHFQAHVRARPSSFQYPEGELDLLIQLLVRFGPF